MVALERPLRAPEPCRRLAATSSIELPGAPSVALGTSRGGATALFFLQVKENNYRGHGDSVDQLCWHPSNPDLFVTASGDKTIRIWDVRTTKCIATVNTKGGSLPLPGSVTQPFHCFWWLRGLCVLLLVLCRTQPASAGVRSAAWTRAALCWCQDWRHC